jgi:hypothetical protein
MTPSGRASTPGSRRSFALGTRCSGRGAGRGAWQRPLLGSGVGCLRGRCNRRDENRDRREDVTLATHEIPPFGALR